MGGKILITDFAPIVVVTGIIERSIDSKVSVQIAHVVTHHINHDQNPSLVTSTYEINKVFLTAEVVIQFVEIASPIPMIPSIAVINDGWNPNGIEAHSLNIVEIVDDSAIATSAIVS